ncbi:trimeric intracellular cation channel family protein [Chryseolinea lacunae]|uniref:Trimeric intracellular cation channel family protein n=1 Tax=Chryseolinea lacunae TaxID=2801331 RepID=A0ABS1KV80_9BACT|nr:trimeric intracellular cation channel family protein [Chryseolinea lacunae]MBL0743369.1 trimeric intracellular cation channel family protein [Chryseolinea lacunae]
MNNVPHLIEHLNFDTTFLVFDLLAVFMFAASGALAAIRKKYDFIGVLMLSFVSGLGGGLIRDAIFIQAGPPKAVTDSKYLIIILAAFLLAMIFHGRMHRLKRTIMIVDALGLGAYGVVGAQAALQEGLVPLAAVLVGVFNATGAGLIRDVLIREEPIIFKPGQFYAGAAILGCSVFVLMVVLGNSDHTVAAIVATLTAFSVRMLSIYFNWQTRPILDEDDRS